MTDAVKPFTDVEIDMLRAGPNGAAWDVIPDAKRRVVATIGDLKEKLLIKEGALEIQGGELSRALDEHKRLREALDEMELMYTHCWDLADSGDKLMMAGSVARFDEACRQARIALGRPLYGDNGEIEEDDKELAALSPQQTHRS